MTYRILGEVEEKLSNVVAVQLFEFESGPRNALGEGHWSLGHKVVIYSLQSFLLVSTLLQGSLHKVGLSQVHIDIVGGLLEETFKQVSCPLDGMFDGVREVLQCTDRNSLFRRILGGWIGFGKVGDDNLKRKYISIRMAPHIFWHWRTCVLPLVPNVPDSRRGFL